MAFIFRTILVVSVLTSACRPVSSTSSAPQVAYDEILIPDSEIKDIPFTLCAETIAYHPSNALWLTYLGVSGYTKGDILIPKLESFGLSDVREINGESPLGPYSAQAFYAEHKELGFSVLSFRGTEFDETRDVVSDLNIMSKEYLGWGKVHTGFLESYEVIEPKILQILDEKPVDQTIHLWLTGHSMGGAIGNIFASRLITLQAEGRYPNVKLMGLYSIGAPKFADTDFAKRFDEELFKRNIGIYRIRNHADLITGIPNGLINSSLYAHTGALVYLDSEGGLHSDKTSILENPDYQSALPVDPRDHLTARYFSALKNDYLEKSAAGALGCLAGEANKAGEPLRDYPSS